MDDHKVRGGFLMAETRPLKKYGNSPMRKDNQFYVVGNLLPIFGIEDNHSESFGLMSLDLEQVIQPFRGQNVSLILSGGGIYSIFMIKGSERDGFLLARGELTYFTYDELMKGMDSNKSRKFNRCVACCERHVILEMEDEELYIFGTVGGSFQPFPTTKQQKVKSIAYNIMSMCIAVYYNDHALRIMNLDDEDTFEGEEIPLPNNSPLKLMTKYSADLFIFVDQNDSMYVYRDDDESDGFKDIPFQVTTHIETASVFKSPIKQLASGYAHFVVLLENGQAYTRGMNNYGQINGVIGGEGSTLDSFHPLLHNIGPVISVNCSSLATTLETKSEILIIGEVSQTFQKLDYPLCKGWHSYWVHRKEFPDESTSFGPWHGFIYRSEFAFNRSNKTLHYFRNNLKLHGSSYKPMLCDISIRNQDM